jgi:hypothetical protein
MFKKAFMILVIIILGGIVFYQGVCIFGDYYINNYDYNVTLINIATENGEIIIEGLLKLKGIKYKKNDVGQIQVRGKDKKIFGEISNLGHTYKNYLFTPKNKIQEIIGELKDQKIKFETINNVEGDKVFIIWEDVRK